MTAEERGIVSARAMALSGALRPFGRNEDAMVNAQIAAMLGGFRSMRQQGDDVEATIEVLRHVLREFPLWAITKGCMKIAQRQAGLDPTWPPNDAQVYSVVSGEVQFWRARLKMAEALLSAKIEPLRPPSPTKEEIDAKLGRPIADRESKATGDGIKRYGDGDGKHALRVQADLESRRARRVAAEGEGAPK